VLSLLLATLGLVTAGAKEGAQPGDLPLFAVERSRVIWPQRCSGPSPQVPPELRSQMHRALGEKGLFIGDGRMDEVTFEPPECMRGECGSGQLAVPLAVRESERIGILLRTGQIETGTIHPLRLVSIEGTDPDDLRPGPAPAIESPPPCGEPPPAPSVSPGGGLLVSCLTHLDPGGDLGVQIQGRGRLQENGHARYDVVRFRVLERREGKRVLGRWHAQPRGNGSHLPVPIAAVSGTKGADLRLLWLHREGICCPSAASTWVTEVGEQVRDGPRHVAGFGQPCD
jgi:hypothetical protein